MLGSEDGIPFNMSVVNGQKDNVEDKVAKNNQRLQSSWDQTDWNFGKKHWLQMLISEQWRQSDESSHGVGELVGTSDTQDTWEQISSPLVNTGNEENAGPVSNEGNTVTETVSNVIPSHLGGQVHKSIFLSWSKHRAGGDIAFGDIVGFVFRDVDKLALVLGVSFVNLFSSDLCFELFATTDDVIVGNFVEFAGVVVVAVSQRSKTPIFGTDAWTGGGLLFLLLEVRIVDERKISFGGRGFTCWTEESSSSDSSFTTGVDVVFVWVVLVWSSSR